MSCDSKSDLKVDKAIEQTFSNYVEYWSEGDFDKIVNEIYGVPFVIIYPREYNGYEYRKRG